MAKLAQFDGMVPLLQGAYSARSKRAAAQRCVNLYFETNPDAEEMPATCYPTPGLTLLAEAEGPYWRGLYWASWSQAYGVMGTKFYHISSTWILTELGTVEAGNSPAVMRDNGTTLLIALGGTLAYEYSLADGFAVYNPENFQGATSFAYIDTFMVNNIPGTKNFQCTLSNTTTYDPLYIAGKVGSPDFLLNIVAMHRELWLVGQMTTEVWYDVGDAGFPFAIMPGVFLEHGTMAPYSLATHDLAVFFISQDKDGRGIVVMGVDYKLTRISNFGVEYSLSQYSVNELAAALGWCMVIQGHVWYVLTLARNTWVFDRTTGQWFEWLYTTTDGEEQPHRARCSALLYGTVVAGDRENGKLYKVDIDNYTDNGDVIVRRRGFVHLVQNGKRVSYPAFAADVSGGTITDAAFSLVGPNIYMRYSNDGGQTWSQPRGRSLGRVGQYNIQPIWRKLGQGRWRVFELFWSAPCDAALLGAYIDARPEI